MELTKYKNTRLLITQIVPEGEFPSQKCEITFLRTEISLSITVDRDLSAGHQSES